MTKLYSQLAQAYHEMYQTIFDYNKEFKYYDRILKKNKKQKVLEIGCGSGNLAPYFLKEKYNYTGLDLAKEMVAIAKTIAPRANFIIGDMRNIKIDDTYDAIIISGRSFAYLTTNKDVLSCLKTVREHLNKNGLLIFDNFDAVKMFSNFTSTFTQKANYGTKKYVRVNKKTMNLQTGWTWNWDATYKITDQGRTNIFKDHSVLRAYTIDELKLHLTLAKFQIREVTPEDWSFTVIAKPQ